jgi:ubiquinone biosynthesis protein COQ9
MAAAAVSAAAVLGFAAATGPRVTPAWQQPAVQCRSNTSSRGSGRGNEGAGAGFSRYYDQQQQQQQPQPPEEDDSEQFAEQRRQLLAAALPHVQRLGWSGGEAAAAAAADLGLSPAAAGILGSDAELVQLFFEECNKQLEAQLAGMQPELEGMDIRWEQAACLADNQTW